MEKFRIGLFTSAWDEVAWRLVQDVHRNVQSGLIPNSEITFVFVSREEGETRFGDLMIRNVRAAGLPLITFSSMRFEPWLRKTGKWLEKSLRRSFLMDFWRNLHDREVMRRLPTTELIVLLGYMWWLGEEMCQRQTTIINLHPALPGGPKGTYKEVIWELINSHATNTGVMMHLVTPALDRGPAIAFCCFSIRGSDFDPLWQKLYKRLEKERWERIVEKEGENNLLFKLIRQKGVIREFSMVVWTIKILADRKVGIKNGMVIDPEGQVLVGGCDLTKEIDTAIKEKI